MTTFSLLATVAASTKRPPATSSGLRGAPATNLTGLLVTPLDPVDPELRQRLGIDTPHTLLQTFVDGASDIVEGDWLVIGSDEYPIKRLSAWPAGVTSPVYRQLILEDLKR
jgi:hypothetical protein